MMQVALFGGAFNPIHRGHLLLARQFTAAFPDVSLFWVPSSLSAHKSNAELLPPFHRINMIQLALNDPAYASSARRWFLERCEVEGGGISRTADTVRLMKERYGADTKVYLLIGDDLVSGLPSWREPEFLSRAATWVVAGRNRLSPAAAALLPPTAVFLHNPLVEITSTRVRQACSDSASAASAKGKAAAVHRLRRWLPQGVWDYIQQHHLYGCR